MIGHIFILDGVIYLCNLLTNRSELNISSPTQQYPHATVYCGVMIPINYDSFIIRDWLIGGFDAIKCLEDNVYKALVFTPDFKIIEIILSMRNGERRAVVNTLQLDKDTRYAIAEDSTSSSMLVTALYANVDVEETKKGLFAMSKKLYPFRRESYIEWTLGKMVDAAKSTCNYPYTPFSSPDTWNKK